jgi:hypothetical protein
VLETKKTLIGSHYYSVTELQASKARNLLVRIVKVAGPILSGLMEDEDLINGAPKAEGDESPSLVQRVSAVDHKTLAKMLVTFSDRIKEEDLEYLCAVLGEVTEVGEVGKPQNRITLDLEIQEIHFKGKLSHMFKWLGFALEVQYADFFPSAGKLKTKPVPAETGISP